MSLRWKRTGSSCLSGSKLPPYMIFWSSVSLPEKLMTLLLFTAVYRSIVFMSHVLVVSSLIEDIWVYFKVLSFEANGNKVVSLTPFSEWWLLVYRKPADFCVSFASHHLLEEFISTRNFLEDSKGSLL